MEILPNSEKKRLNREESFPSRKKVQQFLDFDNEVLDQEISFEALTSGLGFSQKKENEIESLPPSRDFSRTIITEENLEKARPESFDRDQIRDDLKFFYQTENEREETSVELSSMNEVRLEDQKAKMTSRLSAYSLDLLFIGILAAGTVAVLNILLTVISGQNTLAWGNETFLIFGFFSSLFYFTYFSISERVDGSTPGKRLMNLELSSKDGNEISLDQTLTRSIVSFIGLFLLGLPALFGADEFLSRLTIIKK